MRFVLRLFTLFVAIDMDEIWRCSFLCDLLVLMVAGALILNVCKMKYRKIREE